VEVSVGLHLFDDIEIQFRQFTYNVMLRRVRATIVVIEKQQLRVLRILRVCSCRCKYPACNVHAWYCHFRPADLYNIFSPYLI